MNRAVFHISKRLLTTSSPCSARKTVICENGVVASWHPEESVPFEQTQPIDLTEAKEKTVLAEKIARHSKYLQPPNNAELKALFYTNKNEWYTRTREDRLRELAGPRAKRH